MQFYQRPIPFLVHATCLIHLILLELSLKQCLRTSTNYEDSSLDNFLQPPDASFILGQNIFLSAGFK
jgi:hypothetical protein